MGSHDAVKEIVEKLVLAELDGQPAIANVNAGVFCACCTPGRCRKSFGWRGEIRCGCPKISPDRATR